MADDSNQQIEGNTEHGEGEQQTWRSCFMEIAELVGFVRSSADNLNKDSVIRAIKNLIERKIKLEEEVNLIRKREAALQLHLADRKAGELDLRRNVHSLQLASEPGIVQLKQLQLDPAVHRQFSKLKEENESLSKKLKEAEEQRSNVSTEQRQHQLLMAKCRQLMTENEDLGMQLNEGELHQVQSQLALQIQYAEQLQKSYQELEDQQFALDEENEKLHREVFIRVRENDRLRQELSTHRDNERKRERRAEVRRNDAKKDRDYPREREGEKTKKRK